MSERPTEGMNTMHMGMDEILQQFYAMCAADMLGARSLHLEEIEVQPRTEVKQQEPAPEPENNWLGTSGQWL